jgi:pyrimidine-nucleoside phosphorylase
MSGLPPPVDVILAKRRGEAHERSTLEAFVGGFVRGEVPDYQVAAWLMAVCSQGMSDRETTDLTEVMASSGDRLDLSTLPHPVDKHSTGGVGDTTTLVVAPLVAALGASVAKMSGRGLGHTGGTIDKLESIPGFHATLDRERFLRQVREIGIAVTGQSGDLAPADGMLYALRDATGTVASIPLIASSIMSKKLAGGAATIVLDVKVGRGAFMRNEGDARALARAMVAIGEHAGRDVRAVLSRMDEPLGSAVGHALEVREALATLRGGGSADLRELSVVLASELLVATGLVTGREEVEAALDDGRAAERFERWIAAQGGDVAALETLEIADGEHLWRAPHAGALHALDAERIGLAVARLGGGRRRKGDAIDLGVGATVHVKVGADVAAGEPLLTLHHRDGHGLDAALAALEGAAAIGAPRAVPPLVLGRIDAMSGAG